MASASSNSAAMVVGRKTPTPEPQRWPNNPFSIGKWRVNSKHMSNKADKANQLFQETDCQFLLFLLTFIQGFFDDHMELSGGLALWTHPSQQSPSVRLQHCPHVLLYALAADGLGSLQVGTDALPEFWPFRKVADQKFPTNPNGSWPKIYKIPLNTSKYQPANIFQNWMLLKTIFVGPRVWINKSQVRSRPHCAARYSRLLPFPRPKASQAALPKQGSWLDLGRGFQRSSNLVSWYMI